MYNAFYVHALSNLSTLKVNFQLELNGSLSDCEKIVAGHVEKSIDCNDLFFNDGPFLDTRTIKFTLFNRGNDPTLHSYEICLYGAYGENITLCTSINDLERLISNSVEITFRFTDGGVVVDNPSMQRNTSKNDTVLNIIIYNNKREELCQELILYVNHPLLINNKTKVDCSKLYNDLGWHMQSPIQAITFEKKFPLGYLKKMKFLKYVSNSSII